jgi:DNA (cytosine-5)-methyltransferase 1
MKYLSVCSGIEAATVAWHGLGWQPVAFSEIEPFPSAVLAHHYPNVPNLGDMTKFTEWPDESIDLLVGGTPCQSFSVAGLRKGLEDPRGNLMLTYLAIAQRYRPRWLVWENVPGVLSSNGGRDFGTFRGALGELGDGWAYRVLDAQWFGVAQRRRRVFVVGHLGDWQRAAKVLFERESVRRDSPPSREAREAVAGTIAARFGISRNNHEELAWSECVGGGPAGDECYNMVAQPVAMRESGQGYWMQDSISDTMRSDSNRSGKEGTVVAQPVAFRDPCPTLTAKMQGSSGWAPQNEDAHLVGVAQPVCGDSRYWCRACGKAFADPHAADVGGLAPAECPQCGEERAVDVVAQPVAPALTASNDPSRSPQSSEVTQQVAVVHATAMQVRRLTPVECERLQGFPDGYTNIPWRKKPEAPDGPRYKALGNSMAVPCMAWIGKRIAEVDNDPLA